MSVPTGEADDNFGVRTNTDRTAWPKLLRWLPEGWLQPRATGESVRRRMVCLRPNQLLLLDKVRGVKRIRVQCGCIWLTGTPGTDDILLRPGDEFDLGDSWPFLLQPLLNLEATVELMRET